MRYQVLLMAIALTGCNSYSEADKIVEESVKAHGGWEAWHNLKVVSYDKAYDLYREKSVRKCF